MTIDERIQMELDRVKREFSAHEWFTLRGVLAAAFRRLLENPHGHS